SVCVADAPERSDFEPAWRRIATDSAGVAARREAVRNDDDVSASNELSRPAIRRAARARSKAAAVVHDHNGGKRPGSVVVQQSGGNLLRGAIRRCGGNG